jgi:hypothetical protein
MDPVLGDTRRGTSWLAIHILSRPVAYIAYSTRPICDQRAPDLPFATIFRSSAWVEGLARFDSHTYIGQTGLFHGSFNRLRQA